MMKKMLAGEKMNKSLMLITSLILFLPAASHPQTKAPFPVGWRAAVWAIDGREAVGRIAVHWLPGHLDAFGCGIALAAVSVWAASRPAPSPVLERVGRLSGLWWALAAACCWVMVEHLGLSRSPEAADTPIWAPGYAWFGLQVAVAVLLALPAVFGPPDVGMVRRFLRWGPVAWVGLVSYGVYLWHAGWLQWSLERTGRPDVVDLLETGSRVQRSTFPLVFTMVLALSVATATVLWFAVERPLGRLKDVPGRRSLAPRVPRTDRASPTT